MVKLGGKKIRFAMTDTHDGFQAFETCPSPPQQQVNGITAPELRDERARQYVGVFVLKRSSWIMQAAT